MKRAALTAALLIAGNTGYATLADPQPGARWLDPVSARVIAVEGLPWFASTAKYRRLPADPGNREFREPVNGLANQTAGAQLRFRTNSPFVKIRVKLPYRSKMHNMAPTGHSGTDLYDRTTGDLRFCGTALFDADATQYESDLCNWGTTAWKDVTINLPLYNGVERIEVGVAENAQVEAPLAHARDGRLVIYGTSITQGASASRPGMAWTNQVSRSLDVEVIDLGFAGNGMGEPALARRIAELDRVRAVVLDYEANAQAGVRPTLAPFIDIIRQRHPAIPIVVVSQIPWLWERRSESYSESKRALREFQEKTVSDLRARGDLNIHFIDGYGLMPFDQFEDGLADGVHPNDLGMSWIAHGLTERLSKVGI